MIGVVDYGIGNLRSAEKALEALGVDAALVDDADQLRRAAGVVLPGVGAFGRCREALADSGLEAAVVDVLERGTPFLGICVGFQLLYEGSAESPATPGLGYFSGQVERLSASEKVPQMQWNCLERRGDRPSQLLEGEVDPWVYFVHSYAPPLGPETVATCDYGGPVAALAEQGTVFGAQFHPEKSGPTGLRILERFCRLVGEHAWS